MSAPAPLFIVAVVGDRGAGKTSFTTRFASDTFSDVHTPTIGLDFTTKKVSLHGVEVRLQLWELGGADVRRGLPDTHRAVFRGVHGVIIVGSIQESAAESLRAWLEEVELLAPRTAVKMIVGAKDDDLNAFGGLVDEAAAFAASRRVLFASTSAMEGRGVSGAMMRLVAAMCDARGVRGPKPHAKPQQRPPPQPLQLQMQPPPPPPQSHPRAKPSLVSPRGGVRPSPVHMQGAFTPQTRAPPSSVVAATKLQAAHRGSVDRRLLARHGWRQQQQRQLRVRQAAATHVQAAHRGHADRRKHAARKRHQQLARPPPVPYSSQSEPPAEVAAEAPPVEARLQSTARFSPESPAEAMLAYEAAVERAAEAEAALEAARAAQPPSPSPPTQEPPAAQAARLPSSPAPQASPPLVFMRGDSMVSEIGVPIGHAGQLVDVARLSSVEQQAMDALPEASRVEALALFQQLSSSRRPAASPTPALAPPPVAAGRSPPGPPPRQRDLAAARLQAAHRGSVDRRMLVARQRQSQFEQQQRRRHAAAVQMQARHRGHSARQLTSALAAQAAPRPSPHRAPATAAASSSSGSTPILRFAPDGSMRPAECDAASSSPTLPSSTGPRAPLAPPPVTAGIAPPGMPPPARLAPPPVPSGQAPPGPPPPHTPPNSSTGTMGGMGSGDDARRAMAARQLQAVHRGNSTRQVLDQFSLHTASIILERHSPPAARAKAAPRNASSRFGSANLTKLSAPRPPPTTKAPAVATARAGASGAPRPTSRSPPVPAPTFAPTAAPASMQVPPPVLAAPAAVSPNPPSVRSPPHRACEASSLVQCEEPPVPLASAVRCCVPPTSAPPPPTPPPLPPPPPQRSSAPWHAIFRCMPWSVPKSIDERLQDETRSAVSIQRRWRGRSKQLTLKIRLALKALPPGAAAGACAGGLDGIGAMVCDELGAQVWSRAIYNAPPEWDEEEMAAAMTQALCRPARAAEVWLLAKPTRMERALISMYASLPPRPPKRQTPTPAAAPPPRAAVLAATAPAPVPTAAPLPPAHPSFLTDIGMRAGGTRAAAPTIHAAPAAPTALRPAFAPAPARSPAAPAPAPAPAFGNVVALAARSAAANNRPARSVADAVPEHKQDPTTAAVQWVAAVTGADLAVDAPELSRTPSDLTRAHEWLRSGEVLCALANAIRPGSVGKVARSGQGGAGAKPFRQMENIAQYLDACAAVGVPAHDLFRTVDLFEGSSMRQVVRNLHSLGRVAQSVAGFGGPHLGARLATRTQRSFSDAQMAKAKGMPSKWMAVQQTLSEQISAHRSTLKPVYREWEKPSEL